MTNGGAGFTRGSQGLRGSWSLLDEIHKFKGWKRFIKGQYDTLKDKFRFLVTGSARLDIYRKGGDSLQGRYHYYRLHPLLSGGNARPQNAA